MKTDKLILTNRSALSAKYGSGLANITTALTALQAFDKKRNINTDVIYLDDATQMKGYKAIAVTRTGDARQCKAAVDALYKFFTPDYIMLLGAQDVIPFVSLGNPAQGNGDADTFVPSDLPYACEAPYSTVAGKFVTITRVVGRLPDVPGGTDPGYLVSLINDIISSVPVTAGNYRTYFAATAAQWQHSTHLSISNVFGNTDSLHLVPPKGPKWLANELKPLVHFYNCHGAPEDPCFYGQEGTNYPVSLLSAHLDGNVSAATVVAAECCYGAQLYDLQKTGNMHMSIANAYLKNHALGFVGSSTIAYGPAEGNGLADLITQHFIAGVLQGASMGRALLEARQKFLVEAGPTFDPYELKTLAQFYLLGDPSVQPVINSKATPALKKAEVKNSRKNRRNNIAAKAVALGNMVAMPKKVASHKTSQSVSRTISQLLKQNDFNKKACTASIYRNEKKKSSDGLKAFIPDVHFHVFAQRVDDHDKIKKLKVLVVKESSGEVMGYHTYISK